MSLIRIFLILILLKPLWALAIVMPDQPRLSTRLYLNSDYIENSSLESSQRYGITAILRSPAPWGLDKFLYCSLLTNIDPEFQRRSSSVDIRENFYSMNATIDFSYIYLFRYAVFVGGGVLWASTKYTIFDNKTTYNDFSRIASMGLMIDYAISQNWEIGWILQTQFRSVAKKIDWRHGFGLIYNF